MFKSLSAIAMASGLLLAGCTDSKPAVESPAEKAQDEKIQELTKRVSALEQKPVQHHYELRSEGLRTWRFDPGTGDSCIKLTSKADWKEADTIRQGCEYQDYVKAPLDQGEDYRSRIADAEYIYVGKSKPVK